MAAPLITLTERAAERARELLARAEVPAVGLRLGVSNKGCSGLSYVVEYADGPRKFEEVVKAKGVTIFVDPKAVMYLVGAEMDYVEGMLKSGFEFKNPNEKGRCGCGESFHV